MFFQILQGIYLGSSFQTKSNVNAVYEKGLDARSRKIYPKLISQSHNEAQLGNTHQLHLFFVLGSSMDVEYHNIDRFLKTGAVCPKFGPKIWA